VANVDDRLSKLEKGLPPEEDPEADLKWAVTCDILEEYSHLKASRAKNSWRGGTPMVRIEPEDIPGKILGEGYTHGQMMGLAVRRVFEREHELEPDILDRETTEMLIEQWTAAMRQYITSNGYDWDEVEA
jgi:hypothetical protein